MPDVLGVALKASLGSAKTNLSTAEILSIEYNDQEKTWVISSGLFPIGQQGLADALDVASGFPTTKYKYDSKIKYFEEDGSAMCRAVMIAKLSATVNGVAGETTIMTSSYNINEITNKTAVHETSGQKGSQCHAEMFCYYRIWTLLDVFKAAAKTQKKAVTGLSVKGVVRFSGKGSFAANDCFACQKVYGQLKAAHPEVDLLTVS
jgi:hypothetical protein